jgi:hypothetical protein
MRQRSGSAKTYIHSDNIATVGEEEYTNMILMQKISETKFWSVWWFYEEDVAESVPRERNAER